MKVLLAVTGSVAAKLTSKLIVELKNAGHEVRLVGTESCKHFVKDQMDDAGDLEGAIIYFDADEWYRYKSVSKVLHIDLVKWCDVMLIAPLTANTLAKIANGICDNLVTCCARALPEGKPMIIAPAMNTQMWNHPITSIQLKELFGRGVYMCEPVEKKLYCGDTGVGAMADIKDIVSVVGIIEQRHGAKEV